MKLSKLKFKVPINLIAQQPLPKRENAKMMVVEKSTGKMVNRKVKDLPEYFEENDAFIINTTKVINSKLVGKKEKTGHKIDIIMLRELNKEQRVWDVIVDPARKIRMGNKLYFGHSDELVAEIIDNTTNRGRTLKFLFNGTDEEFEHILKQEGNVLLPDYIKQKHNSKIHESYNPFYATHEGSIVAPFAGIHLTPFILKRLESQGVLVSDVITHNGLANHKPIEVEDLNRYKVEVDYNYISPTTANIINTSNSMGKRVCAVGVSTLRTIEDSLNTKNEVVPTSGLNKLFLYPPYEFKAVNTLFCNFNVPKTLFHIASLAFAGQELMTEVYTKAIKDKYRFYAFGDSMLIIE